MKVLISLLAIAASGFGATLPGPPGATPMPAAGPAGMAAVPSAAPAPVAAPLRQMTVRIKDIAHIQGARENQLIGYGLVVGLNGTGDSSTLARDVIRNGLERLRVSVDTKALDAKNAALVTVTATLPAFARPGTRIDVLVSSLADAKSLQGGVLLQTHLVGADKQVYAIGQGPVSIGGFAAGGAAASIQKGHPTVGNVPNGGLIERAVPVTLSTDSTLTLCLREPDFTTSARVAEAINQVIPGSARPLDGGSVAVAIPPDRREPDQLVPFIARLEEVQVRPDAVARVIINERTGTIVTGARVRIAQVAIAHGSLVFITRESAEVSQPAPFSDGQTVVTPSTQLEVHEPERSVIVLDEAPTVADVARALNALGVKPNDIIAIFQAIKQAGALPAELIVQ